MCNVQKIPFQPALLFVHDPKSFRKRETVAVYIYQFQKFRYFMIEFRHTNF